ncbi:unnamed protein product [Thlaspi arvense]|uniref:RNase H type-1 domain-containing protein n=1 Tax=Thlaspi arvense TaxID=13288 RepID=A0AAU9RAF0_THLAR|nr:unnamed protein product [Thlaspi arvense]CAH2034102.1 unnamed protein product [Thlaspi arvense]
MTLSNARESEYQASIMAMQHCWSQRFRKVIFEGDCKQIIDQISGKVLHFGDYNWLREVRHWSTKFDEVYNSDGQIDQTMQ